MKINNEIQVRGKNYKVCAFTGKVAHSHKQLETVVSGSGGGGTTSQGLGSTAPVTIHSTTYTHDDIFLVNAHGEEQVFRLLDWDITTRAGHEIRVIWVVKRGKQSGPIVFINNLTLKELQWVNKQTLHKIFGYPALNATVFILSLLVCSAIGSVLEEMKVNFFIPFIVLFFYILFFQFFLTYRAAAEAKAKLKSFIQSI